MIDNAINTERGLRNSTHDRLPRVTDIGSGVSTEEKGVHGWIRKTCHHAHKRELLVQGQVNSPGGQESRITERTSTSSSPASAAKLVDGDK